MRPSVSTVSCWPASLWSSALRPIGERNLLGRYVFIYEGADATALAALGEVRTPSIADLFVAKMQPRTST